MGERAKLLVTRQGCARVIFPGGGQRISAIPSITGSSFLLPLQVLSLALSFILAQFPLYTYDFQRCSIFFYAISFIFSSATGCTAALPFCLCLSFATTLTFFHSKPRLKTNAAQEAARAKMNISLIAFLYASRSSSRICGEWAAKAGRLYAPAATTAEGGSCGIVFSTSKVSRLRKMVWAMQRLRALHYSGLDRGGQ
jgi:hypothetical protein